MNYTLWVDVFDSLLRNIDFLLSDSRVQSDDLSVYIRWRHGVVIYNSDLTHTTSDYGLNGISSYASYTEDSYMRSL